MVCAGRSEETVRVVVRVRIASSLDRGTALYVYVFRQWTLTHSLTHSLTRGSCFPLSRKPVCTVREEEKGNGMEGKGMILPASCS